MSDEQKPLPKTDSKSRTKWSKRRGDYANFYGPKDQKSKKINGKKALDFAMDEISEKIKSEKKEEDTKKSEWTNEPMTLQKIATAGHVLNTANQVGGAATEGLKHKPGNTAPTAPKAPKADKPPQAEAHHAKELKSKPFAEPSNAQKLKAKYAKIQAKKELSSKNPKEDWDKHLALKTEELADKARDILNKSQGLLDFPGLSVKTNTNNVRVVTNLKEKKLHDRATANELLSTERIEGFKQKLAAKGSSPEQIEQATKTLHHEQYKATARGNSPTKTGGSMVHGLEGGGTRSNGKKAFAHAFAGKYSGVERNKKDEELSPEKLAERGRRTESVKGHEAHHFAFKEIANVHGEEFRRQLAKHIIQKAFDRDTMTSLQAHCINKGYKVLDHFHEEMLNHARDIITNEHSRNSFMNGLGRHLDEETKRQKINGIKKGWKMALAIAKEAHPDMFKQKEEPLAASEASQDESWYFLDEDDLIKNYPPEEEGIKHPEFHDGKPWVSKRHPSGKMMWHAHEDQANQIDSIIKKRDHHKQIMKRLKGPHLAAYTDFMSKLVRDENRHYIPSEEGGKPVLRARHIKALLTGSDSIQLDDSHPDYLTFHRNSHSQGIHSGKTVSVRIPTKKETV